MENKRISWDIQALKQFNKSILYIAEDSIQNAEKVRFAVLEKIEQIAIHPEIHPPDKYKTNNDGNYRAFELHRIRVAYYIVPDIIRILRVRHTSREPLPY
jgi:plasmid stabilization system protein ParE